MKLLIILLAIASPLSAAVTITYDFQALRDDNGLAVQDGTLFALIAADSGDLLAGPSDLLGAEISVGNNIGGKFRIFDVGTTQEAFGNGGNATNTVSGLTYGTGNGQLIEGNQWAIYWFLGGLAEGGTVVAGQKYGMFSSTLLDATSSVGATDPQPTILPTDGTVNAETYYFDTDNGGGVATSSFNANLTVIPEPSAFLLGLLGAGSIFLRRRR